MTAETGTAIAVQHITTTEGEGQAMTHTVKTTLNDEVLTVEDAELRDLERLGILVEVDGEAVGTEEEPTGDEPTGDEPKTTDTQGTPPLGDAPGVPTTVGTTPRASGRKGKE